MIVKCIENRVNKISDPKQIVHFQQYINVEELCIEKNKLYVVFGIIFRDGCPWFLICEEENALYPKPHYFAFFEIITGNLQNNWIYLQNSQMNLGEVALLPDKWANDSWFLEKLINDNQEAIDYFNELKKCYSQELIDFSECVDF